MSAYKLFQELEAGRLVIRGRVSSSNPLLVNMNLYCIVKFPDGIHTVTRLMRCRFHADAKVCKPLLFEVVGEAPIGQADSLLTAWRKAASTWSYYWAEGQVSFTLLREDSDNISIPEASVQALPHIARCIDALNRADVDDFPHDEYASVYRETADAMVLKLSAIYTNLIRRWELCVPVL